MKKNGKKNSQKHPLLTAAKVVTIVLAAWFSCAMPVLSGAGLIYNRGSYGAELTRVGVFLIAAGVVMSLGAVLCLFRKNLANVAAVILSCGGFALCMTMLHKLALHADKSGWSDKYTMAPISDMYRSRLIPSIIPTVLVIFVAVAQLLSLELKEERRERRKLKKDKENAPAPSVLGNDE